MGERRNSLYAAAVAEFGPSLARLTAGYELDADKRRDLSQEIHLQLWRSFEVFDGRCSLKTWTLRVAHNVAASYVGRERRTRSRFVSLEEAELEMCAVSGPAVLDRQRILSELHAFIRELKPIDRQIMISYLEEMEAAEIAEITGLSAAHVAVKIHRVKSILARRFREEQRHV